MKPLQVPDYDAAMPLGRRALELAMERWDADEVPPGSNRGPRVDVYLRGWKDCNGDYYLHYRHAPPVAADGWQGARWCASMAKFYVDAAHWETEGARFPWGGSDVMSAAKMKRAALAAGRWRIYARPGFIAVHLHGDGTGHVGLTAHAAPPVSRLAIISTIEGNQNNGKRWMERPLEYWLEHGGGFVDVG